MKVTRLLPMLMLPLLVTAAAQNKPLFDLTPEVRQGRFAIQTIQKYCNGVDALTHTQAPLIFAANGQGQAVQWRQFASRADWERAGRPLPVVLVWLKEGYLAAMRLSFGEKSSGASYADYCYRADGTLARVAVLPHEPWQGKAKLREEIVVNPEQYYLPNGRHAGIAYWGNRRPFQSETTTYIEAKPPEYLRVSDLPFARLLFPPT